MSGAYSHVDGVEDLLLVFDRLDTALNAKAIAQIFQLAGDFVADDAKARAPFDEEKPEGEVHLRDAIFAKAYVTDGTPAVMIGVEAKDQFGHEGVPYAARIEFGGRDRRAQPFLRPAADACSEQVLNLVAEALKQLIDGAIAK